MATQLYVEVAVKQYLSCNAQRAIYIPLKNVNRAQKQHKKTKRQKTHNKRVTQSKLRTKNVFILSHSRRNSKNDSAFFAG